MQKLKENWMTFTGVAVLSLPGVLMWIGFDSRIHWEFEVKIMKDHNSSRQHEEGEAEELPVGIDYR